MVRQPAKAKSDRKTHAVWDRLVLCVLSAADVGTQQTFQPLTCPAMYHRQPCANLTFWDTLIAATTRLDMWLAVFAALCMLLRFGCWCLGGYHCLCVNLKQSRVGTPSDAIGLNAPGILQANSAGLCSSCEGWSGLQEIRQGKCCRAALCAYRANL